MTGVQTCALPIFDGGLKRRFSAQPEEEGELVELDGEGAAKFAKRSELVELAQVVEPVAGRSPAWNDEARRFEVAEHARRPTRPPSGLSNRQLLHRMNITIDV